MKTKQNITDNQPKRGKGRPTDYKPELHDVLARTLAELGLIESQIAMKLGIAHVTLIDWKKRFPDFAKALSEGKQTPIDQVVSALHKRACGMVVEEKILEPILKDNGKGKKIRTGKMEVTRKIKKEIPPDQSAAILYLKNRDPDNWRDKQDVEHTGEITYKIIPDDELE